MMPASCTWKRIASYRLAVRLVLLVYAIAFLIGTSTHLAGILRGLWFPHHPLLNAYWTCLLFLDPLTVVLLVRTPKAGVLLALIIMLSDVLINSAVSYLYLNAGGPYAVNAFVQLQSVFLGFLLGSAPFVWPHLEARDTA